MIKIKATNVTKVAPAVTKLPRAVTKSRGRPKVYASAVEKQKAYRERKKARRLSVVITNEMIANAALRERPNG